MGTRLLESLHGYLGVLAIAVLVHPIVALARSGGAPPTRSARIALGLSGALSVLAFASGALVYGAYRAHARAALFASHPAAAMLFETKEHASAVALGLALGASLAASLAPDASVALRRGAAMALGCALAASLLAAVIGAYVAALAPL